MFSVPCVDNAYVIEKQKRYIGIDSLADIQPNNVKVKFDMKCHMSNYCMNP